MIHFHPPQNVPASSTVDNTTPLSVIFHQFASNQITSLAPPTLLPCMKLLQPLPDESTAIA